MLPILRTTVLEVGDGHRLHVDEAGSVTGVPVVWIHGGPGAGCTSAVHDLFDASAHRAVLVDQRAAGRSTPYAAEAGIDWGTIDLDHHIADLEAVREALDIDRWIVAGASWGSVLGIAYAECHPDRVMGAVLAAVSTGTRADIDWLTEDGHRYRPDAWQPFHAHASARRPGWRLVDAYRDLVHDPDPGVHEPAALAWCRWEDAHVDRASDSRSDTWAWERYDDPRFRLAFARQVTHCWSQDCWLEPDQLVGHARVLSNVPGWLVHGADDVSSPLGPAERLHEAWPGSRLVVVEDEGHGGDAMWRHVRSALGALATDPSGP